MKSQTHAIQPNNISILGLTGDIIVGVVGGLMGAFFGRSISASIGIQYYGVWAVLIAAAVGAFAFVFIANIYRYVADIRNH